MAVNPTVAYNIPFAILSKFDHINMKNKSAFGNTQRLNSIGINFNMACLYSVEIKAKFSGSNGRNKGYKIKGRPIPIIKPIQNRSYFLSVSRNPIY